MTLTKDDFPTGTRVRVVKFPARSSQIGTTGTVQPHDTKQDPTKQFVFVQRDGRTAGDQFPFRPSELEIITPEIAVGTRVRLDDSGHWSRLAAGKTATVAKVTPEGVITLAMDDVDFHQWTSADDPHFTVLDPEPTAPADLAADLRKHAALLTDDLDEVNIVIAEASEKRDRLRQDIAALKNAAARLEAQK